MTGKAHQYLDYVVFARLINMPCSNYNDNGFHFVVTSMSYKHLILGILIGLSSLNASVQPKEFSIGLQSESKHVEAVILENPKPELPSDMKSEAFKTTCTARFHIEPSGKFEVKLLDSTQNEDIDHLVVATLKKWKFRPASVDGNPVASTRKLKIELEVD